MVKICNESKSVYLSSATRDHLKHNSFSFIIFYPVNIASFIAYCSGHGQLKDSYVISDCLPVPDVVRSAIGFVIYTAVLLIWALTFAIGGKSLFGASWENLVLYRLADNFDLTGNL